MNQRRARFVSSAFRVSNQLFEPVLNHPVIARLAGSEPMRARYRGRRSGAPVELPVWGRRTATGALIRVAAPSQKKWWRNFRGTPHPVEVRVAGTWRTGTGLVHEPRPGNIEVHVTWEPAES